MFIFDFKSNRMVSELPKRSLHGRRFSPLYDFEGVGVFLRRPGSDPDALRFRGGGVFLRRPGRRPGRAKI